jgi:hypothetical protein
MNFFYVLLLLLLVACVPAHSSEPIQSLEPSTLMSEETFAPLLGTVLNVPETNAQVVINDALLAGTLTDLQSSPRGTIELGSRQFLHIAGTAFWVLPAEVQYVSSAGGVYLFLLEQQGEIFVQKQAVNLGNRLELVTLEQSGNTITSVTVDPRTGKPPFTDTPINPPSPGKKVFELREGQLVEIN